MDKCNMRRLTKVKILKLRNDILVQSAGPEKVGQVVVESRLWTFTGCWVGPFWKVDQENTLINVSNRTIEMEGTKPTFSMPPPSSPQSYGTRLAVGTTIRTYCGWNSNISFECMQLTCPSMGGKHNLRFLISAVSDSY